MKITTDIESALCFQLPEYGSLPSELLLVPAQEKIVGRDGRWWLNNDPQAVVNFINNDLGRDLPVDEEHATNLKGPKGESAPAVAWCRNAKLKNGEVWIEVDWLNVGKWMVSGHSYRYYSPVYLYERESRLLVGITSVGLTNDPNLFLPALNHQEHNLGEDMISKAICDALGLAADATEADVVNAINSTKTTLETTKTSLEAAKNSQQTPSLRDYIPRADYETAINRAVDLETELTAKKAADHQKLVEAEINAALAGGIITPATKSYYESQCKTEEGLNQFKEFSKTATPVGDPSKLDGKKPTGTESALNAEEKAVAAMMGVSADDVSKYGKSVG